jgi:hypothetical protein
VARNRLTAHRWLICSPVSIINGKNTALKITQPATKSYSISIIPAEITATAANACRFLLVR